jgi:uncharacterized phage protein gp47/JayE
MTFGVSADGFGIKRLADVISETEAAWKAKFGDGIDLDPRTPEGQIKGILDEQISQLWELAQAVYLSQFPASSEGNVLDQVVSITGTVRKAARKSTVDSGRGRGTFGTIIPAGTIISVAGNSASRFLTDADTTISVAAINEVQRISFSNVPDAGSFKITFSGQTTAVIGFGATAATVLAALEALSNIGAGNVAVTGSYPVRDIQTLAYSATPTAGSFAIRIGAETTSAIPFSASTAAIKAAIEALPAIGVGGVDTVTGSFAAGHTITFAIGEGDVPQIVIVSNVLLAGATPVVVTPATTQAGVGGFTITFQGTLGGLDQPQVTITDNILTRVLVAVTATPSTVTEGDRAKTPLMTLTAETAGPVAAPSGSLTVIVTAVAGLVSFVNELDADLGSDIETDNALRLRRLIELQSPGAATVEAIRADVLAVNDVTAVVVFQNNSAVTDLDGRPAHSVEIVVQGGDDQDIAEAIFDTVAAGIGMVGSVMVEVTDSQGFIHEINFNRPDEIDIYVTVDLTIDMNTFPADGATQVRDAIVEFGDALGIGTDVIVYGSNSLICAFHEIPGITDVTLKISRDSGPPTTDANITIDPDEVADFDTSRTVVNV